MMIKGSKLTKKERKAIGDFRDYLLSKIGKHIVLIELFGSRTRGNSKESSDIDILVVYKGNGRTRKELLNIEWDILKKYDYDVPISIVPYSLREYQHDCKIQTPFIYNVTREGVILWDMSQRRKS